MYLTQAQYKRFTRLFFGLLDHVNETCNVLEEPFEPYDAEFGGEHIVTVASYTFSHRELIDQFIQDKHRSLSADDCEQVSQWKEALCGTFLLAEHTVAHSVFMGSAAVFNVMGLSKNISDIVKSAPALVDTVLLPFENSIVYGFSMTQFPMDIGANMRETIKAECAEMRREGHMATSAEEFMREAPLCRQRDAENKAEDEARRLEEEASLNEPTAGMHVGALAGLTGEERKAAIRKHLDEIDESKDDPEEIRRGRDRNWEPLCLRHAPVRSLEETLLLMSVSQLKKLCKRYGCKGYSKLKKAELVERLLPLVTCCRFSPAELMGASIRLGALELGERVYRAGGMLEVNRDEHSALPAGQYMWPEPPILNVYLHDGKVTGVIPDELMAAIEDEDWEREKTRQVHLQHARHLAGVYLDLCGLISFEDLTEIYTRYYPGEYTREEFISFLFHNGFDVYSRFDFWIYQDKSFVIDYDLVEDDLFDGVGGRAIIDGDGMENPTDEEDFRRFLYDHHAQVGAPWEVPSKTAAELETYEFSRQIEVLPSCVALQSFLDANVPDSFPDDYFFAERIIEELILMARFEYPPQEIIEVLQGFGLAFDSISKMNQMLTLVMNFMNDMPHWADNGWAPSELMKREMEKEAAKGGKKVFYDENGRAVKVGRNEPCPCGSGKKYKRCCGR